MLNWVLDRQTATLIVAILTLVFTVVLYVIIPKGFFPVQDTGAIQGISEAPQTVSFATMAERQQALADVVLTDPAVASLTSFIGVDGTNATLNSGRMLINLKPKAQRDASASDIIRRLQPKLANVNGVTLYMQPVQDLTIEDRVSRTQYQFTVESVDVQNLGTWVRRLTDRLQHVPQLADVASDFSDGGLQAYVEFDRSTASRMGITPAAIDTALYNAFGQRLVSTIFTQSNQYRVVLEVKPEFQLGPAALNDIYVTATVPGQPTQQVPLAHRSDGGRESGAARRSTTSASFPRPRSRSISRAAHRWATRSRRSRRPRPSWRSRTACRSTSRARRSRSARRSPTSCG